MTTKNSTISINDLTDSIDNQPVFFTADDSIFTQFGVHYRQLVVQCDGFELTVDELLSRAEIKVAYDGKLVDNFTEIPLSYQSLATKFGMLVY